MGTDSRVGTEIAGYRIERVLGRGGMGVVYVARHLRLDRTVALKVVSPDLAEDPKFRDRFVRESQLAAFVIARFRDRVRSRGMKRSSTMGCCSLMCRHGTSEQPHRAAAFGSLPPEAQRHLITALPGSLHCLRRARGRGTELSTLTPTGSGLARGIQEVHGEVDPF